MKVGDSDTLKDRFRKLFNYQGNVAINVYFQKFNTDWKEFIELDDTAVLCNRDKLKVIVTPQLVTPCITPKTSIVEDEDVSTLSVALTLSCAGSQASGDTTLTSHYSGDDHDIAACDVSTGPSCMSINSDGDDYVIRGCILDEDEDDAKESTGNVDKKRKIIVKNDTIPLPNHSHYRNTSAQKLLII